MKSSRLYFGILFITLGSILFIGKFFPELPIQDIWKLWPLILLLLGISSIVQYNIIKKVVVALTAIITGIVISNGIFDVGQIHNDIAQGIHDGWNESDEDPFSLQDSVSIPYDSTLSELVSLTISAGASKCSIQGITNDHLLFINRSAALESSRDSITGGNIDKHDALGEFSIIHDIRNKQNFITLDLAGKIDLFENNAIHKSIINLNPSALWDIKVEGGASSFDADLSQYRIKNINFEVGASAVNVKIGSLTDTTMVELSGGAASATFAIPEQSGCRIITSGGLSSHNFIGFTQVSNNVYQTPNYATSPSKIHMSFESGVSSITVKRYTEKTPDKLPIVDTVPLKKMPYKLDRKPAKNAVRL